jgi:hypothetical protein
MSDEQEKSEAGVPIHRYGERDREFQGPGGSPDALEHIDGHLAKHVGEADTVFHEIISDIVHIDVHHVPPGPERSFHTFVTTGMSDLPMKAPPDAEDCRYAELMIYLPASWPICSEPYEALTDDPRYWPIHWLKYLARFPHEYETWLFQGHTIPNGDPPEPFSPDTQLCCWWLLPPLLEADEFSTLKINEEKTIHFFSLAPLYREEIDMKLRKGDEALFDRLDRQGIEPENLLILNVKRKNACKKSFWLV